jgi:hypothetical protein
MSVIPAGIMAHRVRASRREERRHPLLDLPVELVLVTRGEPVREDAHAALSKAAA